MAEPYQNTISGLLKKRAELMGAEKHRLVLVTFLAVRAPDTIRIDPGKADIAFKLPPGDKIRPFARPTKEGTEVFWYSLDRFDETVKVHINFPCQVALDEPGTTKSNLSFHALMQLRDATVKVELFRGEF